MRPFCDCDGLVMEVRCKKLCNRVFGNGNAFIGRLTFSKSTRPLIDKTTPEVEVDIDELLDMDDDNQRRRHLQEILCDAKKSPLDVKKFVDDLLERTKTL